MTARTNAQLKAALQGQDPQAFINDIMDSLQNAADPFVGQHRHPVQTLTVSGAITLNSGVVLLNHATVIIAATLDAPAAGDELYIIDSSASGTAAHTVTLPAGVTFDGSANTATLNAPNEALHIIAISATRWFILENIGAVALTTV